jgi:hypothetical protein
MLTFHHCFSTRIFLTTLPAPLGKPPGRVTLRSFAVPSPRKSPSRNLRRLTAAPQGGAHAH